MKLTWGETDGDCVANGDSEGENDGDIADDVLNPAIEASWLIGERGKSGYWITEPEWLLFPRVDKTGTDLGAMFVNNGGGICFGCCDNLLLADAPLFPLCNDNVSSLSRAISEKTCANGWYCGPQSSK